jgi:DNA polymerase-3 subunit gamma/tau
MIKYLTDISNKEDINIDNNAIQLIAKSSEGSVRDALSILDQANIINIEKDNILAIVSETL